MTRTEEQGNADEAEEIVVLLRNVDGSPAHVSVLDDVEGVPMYELDRNLARAVAYRLLRLADELPEPPRILVRSSDVDERMREQE